MPDEAFLRSIRDSRLRLLAEHWLAGRGKRMMPAWSDIDPTSIAPALPHIWAWRIDETGQLRGRLAGEEIASLLNQSMRGARIADIFPASRARLVEKRFRRVMGDPACVHMEGSIVRTGAMGHRRGERIILPLGADGIHGDGVVGATLYEGGYVNLDSDAPSNITETADFFQIRPRFP
jgi:hypothetical protein